MLAGARTAAMLASLSLAACGWIFPTDDLVDAGGDGASGESSGSGESGSGSGSASGSGSGSDSGSGSGSGGNDAGFSPDGIAAAPICPNKQTVGLLGTVDGTDLEPFSGASTSSWMQMNPPYTMDIYFGPNGTGLLHVEWNTSIAFGQTTSAVCQLTLPSGAIYCGTGQIESLADGAQFYFDGLSAGPVCPSSSAVSGSFVGCLNDAI
jgi:hypothetical protein